MAVEKKIDLSAFNVPALVTQIQYWRTHLDVFIVDILKVDLKPIQRLLARMIGNSIDTDIVQNRGFGKTWLIAICAIAMAILYPGSKIGVVSKTAGQATLVHQKIEEFFVTLPAIRREIIPTKTGKYVSIATDYARCNFYGGSFIEARSIVSILGRRYKIVIGDEKPQVLQEVFNKAVSPTRAEKRPVCYSAGIPDFPSKIINITSACKKNNYFYTDFNTTFNKMLEDNRYFACANDYKACIENGIREADFFEREKDRLPSMVFAMEYGSLFIGEEMGSIFPFNLTDSVRTLRTIELEQPKNSSSDYVIGVDLATTESVHGDNTAMCVFKLAVKKDGTIQRKLVYLRTYHGQRFDVLSNELRKLLVKFPRTIKVVFDMGGLGQPFPEFMSQPWVDPITGKEYPPITLDNERTNISNALPILRGIFPTGMVNQQMVTALRLTLEKKTIELPVDSASMRQSSDGHLYDDEDDIMTGVSLSMQEEAVFIETDALQVEMGNIISRETDAGNIVFKTSNRGEHKDRYSAVAFANLYISELEADLKRRYQYGGANTVVGYTFSF